LHRIVPCVWGGIDCRALVVRDAGPTVGVMVWPTEGCGVVEIDVPRERVEAALRLGAKGEPS